MKVLINKGQQKSLNSNLNYYAIQDKVHIMDNHLAAIYALEHSLQLKKSLNYYHIDRHYDLGPITNSHNEYISGALQITNLNKIDQYVDDMGSPLFMWDNYIHLICTKYKDIFDKAFFITHKTSSFNFDFSDYEELTIFQLINYYPDNLEGNILNLDIDFFFHQDNDSNMSIAFSESTIESFSIWLRNNYNNFELIIIALSPECCDSWDDSVFIANKILSKIGIKINL